MNERLSFLLLISFEKSRKSNVNRHHVTAFRRFINRRAKWLPPCYAVLVLTWHCAYIVLHSSIHNCEHLERDHLSLSLSTPSYGLRSSSNNSTKYQNCQPEHEQEVLSLSLSVQKARGKMLRLSYTFHFFPKKQNKKKGALPGELIHMQLPWLPGIQGKHATELLSWRKEESTERLA